MTRVYVIRAFTTTVRAGNVLQVSPCGFRRSYRRGMFEEGSRQRTNMCEYEFGVKTVHDRAIGKAISWTFPAVVRKIVNETGNPHFGRFVAIEIERF